MAAEEIVYIVEVGVMTVFLIGWLIKMVLDGTKRN